MLIADNDNERDTWVLAGTAALHVVEELKKGRAAEATRPELAGDEPARGGVKQSAEESLCNRARIASPARRSAASSGL